jgi:uncharacterized protein
VSAPPDLPADLARPWQALLARLAGLDSLLVAFSGGVDSTLLLAAARQALGDRAVAALCVGQFTPPWEVDRARRLARQLQVRLIEADARELDDPDIAANPPERCYHCKRRRLLLLQELAAREGLAAVAEGSQADDAHEHRPGARAVAELGVLSPLAETGLGKEAIRRLSRALGLETAAVPSGACLATRIPWGTPLTPQSLHRVARAEAAVRQLLPGRQLRLRDHFPLARLELEPAAIPSAAAEPLRSRLCQAVQNAGYRFVTLDLAGYRSGGANPHLTGS